jgi:hypothetical protein
MQYANEQAQEERQRSAMHLIFRLPLSEYDNFVKALDPSSRAAEILRNASFKREIVEGGFERFMEVSCTEDEQKMLLHLANRYYPTAAPFFRGAINLP